MPTISSRRCQDAPHSAATVSPSGIATAWTELASGQALLLSAIDRNGLTRIAALEKP